MREENQIRKVCLEKYGKDLAAILIFGSYFTGQYRRGVSDIDAIILLKKESSQQDISFLTAALAKHKVFIHHLKSIKKYKQQIYKEASWSSWIAVQCGSKIVYSTPEFRKFKKYLSNHNLEKSKLKKFILEKDKFDLQIDLTKKSGWAATKMLYAHIRRKLQIINYYTNYKLDFNFIDSLEKIRTENKKELIYLAKLYGKRKSLVNTEILSFVKISKNLTKQVTRLLNN